MQWFCGATKLCTISGKIYAAIMEKVTFEITTIQFSLTTLNNKVRKSFTAHPADFLFCDVGDRKQKFLRFGLILRKLLRVKHQISKTK